LPFSFALGSLQESAKSENWVTPAIACFGPGLNDDPFLSLWFECDSQPAFGNDGATHGPWWSR
jgi:hypothetical protein